MAYACCARPSLAPPLPPAAGAATTAVEAGAGAEERKEEEDDDPRASVGPLLPSAAGAAAAAAAAAAGEAAAAAEEEDDDDLNDLLREIEEQEEEDTARELKRGRCASPPSAREPSAAAGRGGIHLDLLPDNLVERILELCNNPRFISSRWHHASVDNFRQQIRQRLSCGLDLPKALSSRIEQEVFAATGRLAGKAYKAKARELIFNLKKERSNEQLRRRLISGELSPMLLVCMSVDDLASEERRAERQKEHEAFIADKRRPRDLSQMSSVSKAHSCPRCSHNETFVRTWRRKRVVDRVRIVLKCLKCNHVWDH